MPDFLTGLLVGVFAGLAGGILLGRWWRPKTDTPLLDSLLERQPAPSAQPGRKSAPPTVNLSRVEDLRQNLRLKCLYDEAMIDRLIENERERNPGASIEDLMEGAIARWEQVNR